MDDVKLSLRQIEKMEHAIGFERGKIKRGNYILIYTYLTKLVMS